MVVVPSRSESFGLVALEAAACGVPVVAAAVLVRPHTRKIKGVRDSKTLSAVVAKAMATDPDKRYQTMDELRQRVELLMQE